MLNLTSVRLEGFIEDVESIWKKHHALILPSRCEGLPLVIVEAMLLGRPVIATRVAGNAEVVENGRTGFLAEAPTEAALDAALEAAWKRRHEWRTMGEAAAVSIRELVPPNPPKIFAQGLLALLTLPDSTNPRHRPL
jgi:glycosyltransferase involved in cell wall biosynthesis